MISRSLNSIQFSTTMDVASKAIELREAGVDLIDLSVGEPDLPTPEFIKKAAKKALDENLTKYTLNKGTLDLRKAIVNKLTKDNNLTYSPDEIIVSTGAKQSLFGAIQTVVDSDDEVLIPTPAYVSYIQMVKFAGGKVKLIKTKQANDFKVSPDDLLKDINGRTKLLLLCNPCNPTGTVYNRNELAAIATIIVENNLLVICDEIYEKLIYDKLSFTSLASINDEIKARTITVNGFSKSYSMTGWRIGYTAADKLIIDSMAKLQSHTTSCTSSVSQAAALAALTGDQKCVNDMKVEFENRRNFVLSKLGQIDNISFNKPEGAFYIFPDVSKFFNKAYNTIKIKNSKDLSLYLLEEAKVAVVPGSGFEEEGYIRISYAHSIKDLDVGLDRIKNALSKLS
jgi:aspartate aminotransferase